MQCGLELGTLSDELLHLILAVLHTMKCHLIVV